MKQSDEGRALSWKWIRRGPCSLDGPPLLRSDAGRALQGMLPRASKPSIIAVRRHARVGGMISGSPMAARFHGFHWAFLSMLPEEKSS